MAAHKVYEFFAALDEFEPEIWRRFQVPGDITLAQLGYVVLTLFEMKASHPFSMERNFGDEEDGLIEFYEIPSCAPAPAFDGETPKDATAVRLDEVVEAGDYYAVNYDFGDDWFVVLRLEKILESKDLPAEDLPRVLKGFGYGIVEDCGGPPELMKLAKAFRRKKGAEYKELAEWLGRDEFNINAFDMEDMNFRLKKIPHIFKKIYEERHEPTQSDIDLIERGYKK